jgi:hypothetical protein
MDVAFYTLESLVVVHELSSIIYTQRGGHGGVQAVGVGVVLGQLKRGVKGAGCGVVADG